MSTTTHHGIAVDDKPKRRRVDWGRVTFWALAGSTAVLLAIAAANKPGVFPTILTHDGRAYLSRSIQIHHPELAGWLGLRSR